MYFYYTLFSNNINCKISPLETHLFCIDFQKHFCSIQKTHGISVSCSIQKIHPENGVPLHLPICQTAEPSSPGVFLTYAALFCLVVFSLLFFVAFSVLLFFIVLCFAIFVFAFCLHFPFPHLTFRTGSPSLPAPYFSNRKSWKSNSLPGRNTKEISHLPEIPESVNSRSV